MKTSSICFALGAAHLALGAPTASSGTGEADGAARAEHGVATAPRTLSSHDSRNHVPRPNTREVPTLFLPEAPGPDSNDPPPPLSRHRRPRPDRQRVTKIDTIRLPIPDSDAGDVLELLELETTLSQQLGMPCHQSISSAERNNMLIVLLAVTFLLAVVVMETWKSISKRQGAIRLDEPARQAALSVQATPDTQDSIRDEKSRT